MAQLAINGGEKTRAKPFPGWPVFDDTEVKAVGDVVRSGNWGMLTGSKVSEFEKKFAEFQDAAYGVCVCNGTVALEVALKAVGVKAGDEVIVPPYTFIASASSVLNIGAIPVFVDIDDDTYNLDPAKIEAAVTPKTKAVLAVHIGGGPADMDGVLAIAGRHGLKVVEDAAQAHGAAWNGRRIGALGDAGTFSFQASKNLTAGEGGIVVTNKPEVYATAWSLHNCGRVPEGKWYEHRILGSNLRMTEFQGAILLEQMKRLEDQMKVREENALYLDSLLSGIGGIKPLVRDPRVTTHAYHLYIFRYVAAAFGGLPRAKFLEALNAEGIPCGAGYVPLYKEQMFYVEPDGCPIGCAFAERKMDYGKVCCPVAENACASESVWFGQNMLLGAKQDMDEIAAAISKIKANVGEITE
ncbi:MAG: DegT/DnrJ/EryC1/StrS family aminotransferase [Armatimonadetes bacterium]|nr:DegT/DnrJ/EryC1/StrS family aminotransferase [Armatimonadota bacterium]